MNTNNIKYNKEYLKKYFKMEEITNTLENVSIPEARKIVLELFPKNCHDVANNFLECVENKLLESIKIREFNFEDIENKLQSDYSPDCGKRFDIDNCINKL